MCEDRCTLTPGQIVQLTSPLDAEVYEAVFGMPGGEPPIAAIVGRDPSWPSANGTVYLSGPITDKTYEDARWGWRKYVAERLNPNIKVLSPMRHEGHLSEMQGKLGGGDSYPDHFFSKAKVLVEKDKLDIARCDIMLVNLMEATAVSIGTAVEVGMAYAMGKTIVVAMQPKGNLHDHPFIKETASVVVHSVDDAIYAVNALLSEGL